MCLNSVTPGVNKSMEFTAPYSESTDFLFKIRAENIFRIRLWILNQIRLTSIICTSAFFTKDLVAH